MTDLAVASAVDSADCDWPSCDREAERDGRCRYHAGRVPGARVDRNDGRVIPGALAHLMDDEEETAVIICKRDGCTNPSAGKGGWCVGLCDEHISVEAKRRQAVRFAKAPTAKPKVVRPVAVKPPPVAVETNGHAKLSLTELAQAVEQARANLDTSVAALREALDAA